MENKIDKNPLISIIVCIYNGEKYLKECINSIITQDYTNLEIILVNDGSKDNSKNIIDNFVKNDSRIISIHKNNSGVSDSRNKALSIANGEYICIIDQDDCISNDYISYFYNLIKINNAQIALTRYADKFFDKIHESKENDDFEIWSGKKACVEMLYHKIIIAPWNKMIKRTLIEKNNIKFDTRFFNGEGFAFSIECFQEANKVVVGKRKVYHYRVGDPTTGASKFKVEWINSSINAQQYIKEKIKEIDEELLAAWEFSNWHTHCDALNVIVGCRQEKNNKELYSSIKKITQKNALLALKAPVSMQQKLRGILFKFNPYFAAKIINKFRIRKFEESK